MSQGYIGYDLQNALREDLLRRGIDKGVATVLTQIEVDPDDPAFANPTKPIGPWMNVVEADGLKERLGYEFTYDEKKGYRRVVASPKPVSIVELDTIGALIAAGQVVVCCGGGGIPVIPTEGHHLKGAAAVIDKDFAAEKLAEQLDADELVILTAVEKVAIGFGTDHEQWLDTLAPEQVAELAAAGEFGAGSMLPKVQAANAFAESKPGRRALITLLEKAADGLAGKTDTSFSSARA